MGWVRVPLKNANFQELRERIPLIRADFAELREWSFRAHRPFTPQELRLAQLAVPMGPSAWAGPRAEVRMKLPSLLEARAVPFPPKPAEGGDSLPFQLPSLLFDTVNASQNCT
jgi:hypothetical protein